MSCHVMFCYVLLCLDEPVPVMWAAAQLYPQLSHHLCSRQTEEVLGLCLSLGW